VRPSATLSSVGLLDSAGFDLASTDRLLTTTRSVRRRLDLERPVPRSILLECLDLALQAPTGANRQRWRWLILDQDGPKNAVAEVYRRGYDRYVEARRSSGDVDGPTFDRNLLSSDHLAQNLERVPALVIPCFLDRPPSGKSQEALAQFYGSILPAAWSLMLALRTRGLGAAWTTLHLSGEAEVASALGIPDTVTQVAMLPVAYYIGEDFRPAPRRPAAQVTYFNSWGVKDLPADVSVDK
jgi:nitroreductase